MTQSRKRLPYNPEELPRELKKYYISATEQEISDMFKRIGLSTRRDLYNSLPEEILFKETPNICERFEYDDLIDHVEEVAKLNNIKPSFIGDGLKWFSVPSIVPKVCDIRGLTTAYTPYQPERSQGTLQTLWIYSSTISMLTGFEAINASFYERSTCLFEAFNTAIRIKKGKNKVIITEGSYPGDIEVIQTLAQETKLEVIIVPLDQKTGLIDQEVLKKVIQEEKEHLAAMAFCQTNHLGLLEDVHALTDLAASEELLSIAIIDPILLAKGGLIPPAKFGKDGQGCDMIVGEGQHLAIGPNFGGPGLGIFGIRYNEKEKMAIRSTAGRYVGKTKDSEGRECLSMVLSTREQHIRREKATSNICSNQSFLATIAGAGILDRGETGMAKAIETARQRALDFANKISCKENVSLAFPDTPFFNEVTIKLPSSSKDFIKKASNQGLHIGVDVSKRVKGHENLLMLFFNDAQTNEDFNTLIKLIDQEFTDSKDKAKEVVTISSELLREGPTGLPDLSSADLLRYYEELGAQNVSPDDNIYPLGSCTMKYNPYINDYAAGLKGFTDIHPQAPIEDAQGCLKVLYSTQEIFKAMTGLPGLTTQPVAGAQGELVGIKMFQAYHRDKGNHQNKNIILIPKSAHGTNPATATMAGFETKKIDGIQYGIVPIEASELGQIDFDQLKKSVDTYGDRIAGIMITNPNTSGIFENRFREIADLIHSVDGLVYMDGANMNAIAGWVNLDEMGVDAVHNNLHKTWTVPHGGGGPGDAIVAVSHRLLDYMPGVQITLKDGKYNVERPLKSIGSFHRHYGNFAHKVRSYTYLKALGSEGVKEMSAIAVLSAKYLYDELKELFPTLPEAAKDEPRLHEFIITLSKETFTRIQDSGTPKAQSIAKIGKLFLDFGLHAPTVAFPEQFGLMIEPTESFSKKELDRFVEIIKSIHHIIHENPEVLISAPHFTPVKKVDEVGANKKLVLSAPIVGIPIVFKNVIAPGELKEMKTQDIVEKIIKAHEEVL